MGEESSGPDGGGDRDATLPAAPRPAARLEVAARARDPDLRGLAIIYMLLPIALIIVFSFNDPAGKFNFTWEGSPSRTGSTPFEIEELTNSLTQPRLAALAT